MRIMLYRLFVTVFLLSPTLATAGPNSLFRCAAAMDPFSEENGRLFQRAISELTGNEQEAFSRYLEWLCQDIAHDRMHIQELTTAEKQKIFDAMFDAGNPWELANAFIKHQRLMDEITGNKPAPESVERLDNFEQLVNQYKQLIAAEAKPPAAQPDRELEPAVEEGRVDTALEGFALETITAPKTRSAASPGLESRAISNPKTFTANDAKVQDLLRQEKLATIVGDLLDPKGGADKSRMLALLITRVEALVTTGSFGEVGNLSVTPESPNILSRGRVLSEAFRSVEIGKSEYESAQARQKYFETLLELDGMVNVRDQIKDEIHQAKIEAKAALKKVGKDIDVYLGIKTYLELVISNRECTVQCRVNALETLAHLGSFDRVIEASKEEVSIVPSAIHQEMEKLSGEERITAAEASAKLQTEVNDTAYNTTGDYARWRNKDVDLMKIANRRTIKRRFWGMVSMIYSSNVFSKVLQFAQKRTFLDRLPFTERFARNARDRHEILNSVGTLLVMSRSNLPVHVKLANIEALASVYPRSLETLHRHSLFRSLLADVEQIKKEAQAGGEGHGDAERLNTRFGLLFANLEVAGKSPDAQRLINLQYDQPRLEKAYNALINSLAIAIVTINMVNPELASKYNMNAYELIPGPVREVMEQVEEPVRGVMEEHDGLRDEIGEEINHHLNQ